MFKIDYIHVYIISHQKEQSTWWTLCRIKYTHEMKPFIVIQKQNLLLHTV